MLLTIPQVYDPDGKGFMDPEILRGTFQSLGFGEISDQDLSLVVEAADRDGDGRVSLADFRGMWNPTPKQKDATTSPCEGEGESDRVS